MRHGTAAGDGVAVQNSPVCIVPQINNLAWRIDYRIVVPGREPVLIAVLRPRIAEAGVRRDKPEARVRDDVGPRRRRPRR